MVSRKHRPRKLNGAFEWSICHYCGGTATTEDHVVPRAAFPVHQIELPGWFRILNVLPACKNCNNVKGHARSDCECDICVWLWDTAIQHDLLKPDFHIVVRKIVLSPG